MTEQNETCFLTETTGAAVVQYRGGKRSSAARTFVHNTVGNVPDCIFQQGADSGAEVLMALIAPNRTYKVMVSGAVALTDVLYAAAVGKFSATPSGYAVFKPLETASNDGEIIEVMALPNGQTTTGSFTKAMSLYDCKLPTGLQLAATAASGVVGLATGTFGSASPALIGNDAKGTTKTDITRFQWVVPANYVAAGNISLKVTAGMNTTVSDTTATVDALAYRADELAGIGSDLCATAAQSINSLTNAEKSFTITGTTLSAGDVLDIELVLAVTDSGAAGVMVAEISRIEFVYTGTY
jgi:hypothetical protein